MLLSNRTPPDKNILVIGLGNPILGDDGVGWRIAEQVQRLLSLQPALVMGNESIEVDCASLGGLSLMERLVGYTSAILVDAITTAKNPPGTVYTLSLDDLPNHALGHLCSSHDTTLQNALNMGRQMGVKLPTCIQIIAIEADQVYNFSETLSPMVAAAVPVAVDQIIRLLQIHDEASSPGQDDPAMLLQGG